MNMNKIVKFLLCFIFIFGFLIISQKFNFISRGMPIGGHTWERIIINLPRTILFSLFWSVIIYYAINQLIERQIKDILVAKKRIEIRETNCSKPYTHNCRVCGYDNFDYPWGKDGKSPTYLICPCCGCQFGVNDITPQDIKKIREYWMKNEYKWNNLLNKPVDWSLENQLENIPEIGNTVS